MPSDALVGQVVVVDRVGAGTAFSPQEPRKLDRPSDHTPIWVRLAA